MKRKISLGDVFWLRKEGCIRVGAEVAPSNWKASGLGGIRNTLQNFNVLKTTDIGNQEWEHRQKTRWQRLRQPWTLPAYMIQSTYSKPDITNGEPRLQ